MERRRTTELAAAIVRLQWRVRAVGRSCESPFSPRPSDPHTEVTFILPPYATKLIKKLFPSSDSFL
jgi:hypothetical protein